MEILDLYFIDHKVFDASNDEIILWWRIGLGPLNQITRFPLNIVMFQCLEKCFLHFKCMAAYITMNAIFESNFSIEFLTTFSKPPATNMNPHIRCLSNSSKKWKNLLFEICSNVLATISRVQNGWWLSNLIALIMQRF